MTPERAQELFQAIQILREAKTEIAAIAPAATLISPAIGAGAGLVVEFEPAAEAVLTLYFEAVSVLSDPAYDDRPREALADRLRANAEAELKEKFPDG